MVALFMCWHFLKTYGVLLLHRLQVAHCLRDSIEISVSISQSSVQIYTDDNIYGALWLFVEGLLLSFTRNLVDYLISVSTWPFIWKWLWFSNLCCSLFSLVRRECIKSTRKTEHIQENHFMMSLHRYIILLWFCILFDVTRMNFCLFLVIIFC